MKGPRGDPLGNSAKRTICDSGPESPAGGGASHARLVRDGPPEGSGKGMSGSCRTPTDSWKARGPTRGKPPPTPRREPDTHTGSAAAPRWGPTKLKCAPEKWGRRGLQLRAARPRGRSRARAADTLHSLPSPRAARRRASCAQSGAVPSLATPLRAARLTCSRWRWRRPGAAACPARPRPPRPAPSCPGH